ncbi:hypothetical protein TSAR_003583 [Trichomalopsis sarcophagae]|uniref:DNA/RNA non-specific endonuclease/pyrophosphatase/phosphodiesterase domain-containing protein n=1 Tax=Trichomalopsis sarcophagae TaxID=543379 RepID=A0A232FC02_9HYME|nr:hypothetical protein TSAR_003583 [Trichomalopsis sarcophagae]
MATTKHTLLSTILFVFILNGYSKFTLSANIENNCLIKKDYIDLDSSKSPLVLYPNYVMNFGMEGFSYSKHLLNYLYPINDVTCFYGDSSRSSMIMRLACPGKTLVFPSSASKINSLNLSSATLILYMKMFLKVTEYSTYFDIDKLRDYPITCSGVYEPTFKSIKPNTYTIGYQINILDFLPTIYLSYDDDKKEITAHAKVKYIVNGKPKVTENNTYVNSLTFDNITFADIYNKEYQLNSLKELLKNDTLLDMYTAGENYLVPAQLISKEDLFYLSEQRCTLFYENTVPMWKSINEGNWKLVDEIIRKLAEETKSDFNIFAGSINTLNINDNLIYFGNYKNNTIVPVPKVVYKIAHDPSVVEKHHSDMHVMQKNVRGVAFITVNDPYVNITKHKNVYCNKLIDNNNIYPSFSIVEKGYTYACALEDFNLWQSIRKIFY